MPLTDDILIALADELFDAETTRRAIAPLKPRCKGLTLTKSYAISRHNLKRRLRRGETLVGKKIGITSPAVQAMLGVDQPDFGFLTDRMMSGPDMVISDRLMQPRAEGELAFKLKTSLNGPGVTPADVIAATEVVIPCFEVVDSRVADWKIAIEDTVADNASCGLFILGEGVPPEGLDYPSLAMTVHKNGEVLARGLGAEALGSPLNCVAWLANTLGDYGITLDAGDIILSGSWVPLEPVQPGDVMSLHIEGVGGCDVRFH
jgi:2-oxopent-4-enoate/cis-2-oxohex-4-enoate hydratase